MGQDLARFELDENSLNFIVHEFYHEPYIIQNVTHIEFDFEVYNAANNLIYEIRNIAYVSRIDERLVEYICSSCEFLQVPHFVEYEFSIDLTPLIGESGCEILINASGIAKARFFDHNGQVFPSQESVCGSLWPSQCQGEVNDEAIIIGSIDCSAIENDRVIKKDSDEMKSLKIIRHSGPTIYAVYSIDGRLLNYLKSYSEKQLQHQINSLYSNMPIRIVPMQ